MARLQERQPSNQVEDPRVPELSRGFIQTFESLRYRDFRLLFFAQMTNAAAQWMQMVGLPILVIATTQSAVHLGAVLVARTIPSLVLGLFSGVVADMWNRRTILLITRTSGTALAIWFAFVNVTGTVSLVDIYVFAILRGITMSFDQAPRRALIPSMVPRHVVMNAMALSTGSMQMMRVLGASAAGILIAIWGTQAAFVALACLYVSGIPFLLMMRVKDHERSGYQGMHQVGVDALDGLKFAWRSPAVRGALIIAAVFHIFGNSFMHVFAPLLASGPLELTEGALGWLVAVMGFGATCGTFFVAYFSPSHHRGLTLTIAMAVYGSLLGAMAGASYLPTALASFGVIWLLGLGQSIFMPLVSTLVLQASPDNMRGRAMSLLSWDRALVSFGSMIAAFATDLFGVQVALLAFAGTCVVTAFLLLSSSSLRRVD
ncbi:MAG: MFS transporter [Chloroflexi bacterium]|nr:MFS transporter [Chloroflexota bacterium]